MPDLILLRHAAAKPAAAGATDFERPLSGRGRSAAARAAQRLRGSGGAIDRLLYSPARRTQETAGILARELALGEDALLAVPELYAASAAAIRAVVKNKRGTTAVLLVVGHNPGISDLGRELVRGLAPEGLSTAAFWRFSFDAENWPALTRGAVVAAGEPDQ